MRTATIFLGLFLAAATAPLRADFLRASVSLGLRSDQRLESKGYVQYIDNAGASVPGEFIWIYHTIVNGGVSYTGTSYTPWSRSMSTPSPAVLGVCYRGRLTVSSRNPDLVTSSVSVGSPNQICYTPTPPPTKPTCPGDPECPPTGSTCLPEDYECQLSPIVINLGNGGYDLTGADDPVTFDLDAEGHADRVAWTARSASMAFLAFDRNGNGRVDDGSELFGDATPLPGGGRAPNGFEALRAYDSNADGVIDNEDPIFGLLVLWVDMNHDGLSQSSEFTMLATTDITALDLDYRREWRRDEHGNTFRYAAHLHRGRRTSTYYDVFFSRAP